MLVSMQKTEFLMVLNMNYSIMAGEPEHTTSKERMAPEYHTIM